LGSVSNWLILLAAAATAGARNRTNWQQSPTQTADNLLFVRVNLRDRVGGCAAAVQGLNFTENR